MPARLVYAPRARVYTKNREGVIYDLSPYITAGQVDRKISQASTASVTLRNPYRRFTTPSKGVAFHPMDPITIYLERVAGHPVRVFTGFLDTTPYYQLYPGTITLQATCTLKRIINSYFDPSLPYVIAFFTQNGWVYNGQGSIVSSKAYNSDTSSTNAVNSGAKPFDSLKDGSLGKLLWSVLTDIGEWPEHNIYIENLPSGKNGIAARMATLMQSLQHDQKVASDDFTAFLQSIIGAGSQGGDPSGAGGTPTLTGNTAAQQIWNYFTQSQGLSKYAAAGIIGNWKQESQLNPSDQGGYIAQWGGSRLSGLIAYAKARGKPVTDLAVQLGWTWYELNTADFKPALDALQSATSAEDAATSFCNLYEKPGIPDLSNRIQYAKDALASFGSGTPDPTKKGKGSRQAGATAPASGGTSLTDSYTSPFPGGAGGASVNGLQRTDMGVDQDLTPIGSNIVAIGNGTVLGVSESGWPGPGSPNNFMWYRLDDGPNQGAIIYYAEGISPAVATGKVTKGQTIATVTAQTSGTEFGYCDESGRTLGTAEWNAEGAAGIPDFARHPTDAGKRFARFIRALGVNTRDDPGPGPCTPTGNSLTTDGKVNGQASGSGNASGAGAASDVTSQATAEAFVTELQFPSVEDQVAATILGSEHKGLMHDQSLLPFVQQIAQASMRQFQSLPNGDFYAFYPDYFGEMGHHNPYWEIDDIEILDGGINLSDDSLATHVFAIGDNTWPAKVDELVRQMFSAGTITIFNAFLSKDILESDTQSKGGMADIMSAEEAVKFIQRYGARPFVQDYPMVRSSIYEMLLAYQQFMFAWSNQFKTPFTFTFMPELYPGGKVSFKQHGLQMYINSVSHSWNYAEGGFTTVAELSAPSKYGEDNVDLPPHMVRAMVEPVQKKTPSSGPHRDAVQTPKQAVQSVASAVDETVTEVISSVKDILGT